MAAKKGPANYAREKNGVPSEDHKPNRASNSNDDLKFNTRSHKRQQQVPVKTLQGTDLDSSEEAANEFTGEEAQQWPGYHQQQDERGNVARPVGQPDAFEGDSAGNQSLQNELLSQSGYVQQALGPNEQQHPSNLAQTHGNQIALQHVKGSTYPSTTSGRLSEIELENNEHRTESALFNAPENAHSTAQWRETRPDSAVNRDGVVQLQHSLPQRGLKHLEAPVKAGVGQDYNYPAAPSLKRAAYQHKHWVNQQGSSGGHFAQNTNAASQGHYSGSFVNAPQTVAEVDEKRPVQVQVPAQIYARGHREHSATGKDGSVEHLTSNHVQRDEERPQLGKPRDWESSAERPLREEADPLPYAVQLDYDPADLMNMDYGKVKAQPFDADPNFDYQVPGGLEGRPLAEQLEGIMALNSEKQAQRFLMSLPLEDWEQAGEWFVERFSTIMKKLVDARQQKRRAAVAFEDEIEHRYNSIGMKRKETNAALSEMRVNGGKVLAGTPKKSKTT